MLRLSSDVALFLIPPPHCVIQPCPWDSDDAGVAGIGPRARPGNDDETRQLLFGDVEGL